MLGWDLLPNSGIRPTFNQRTLCEPQQVKQCLKGQALKLAVLIQTSTLKGNQVDSSRSTAAGLLCSRSSSNLAREKRIQRSALLKVSFIY